MEATFTELRRDTSRLIRAADRGEEVILTDHGTPKARLVAYLPTVIYADAAAMRSGQLSDDAILSGIRESQDGADDNMAVEA